MSRSAGPGSPITFMCAKCRSTLQPDRNRGRSDRVELTGRERPYRSSGYSARGIRSTGVAREYRCLDCGHVGWSAHVDLARRS